MNSKPVSLLYRIAWEKITKTMQIHNKTLVSTSSFIHFNVIKIDSTSPIVLNFSNIESLIYFVKKYK